MYRQKLQAIARESGFPVSEYGDDHFVLTPGIVGELRELPYLERWRLAAERRWYHVRMQDHSLFQFTDGLLPSHQFLHCPLDIMSFPEYLEGLGEEDTPQARRLFLTDYQEVFNTASERRHLTPIRFDYDPNGYAAGVHPVAHIHVGLDNQVRICANKMSSVSFFLFVMRQMYPDSWKRLLHRPGRDTFVRSIRDTTTRLPAEYWADLDRVELYLS